MHRPRRPCGRIVHNLESLHVENFVDNGRASVDKHPRPGDDPVDSATYRGSYALRDHRRALS